MKMTSEDRQQRRTLLVVLILNALLFAGLGVAGWIADRFGARLNLGLGPLLAAAGLALLALPGPGAGFADGPLAEDAARVAAIAKDVTEVMADIMADGGLSDPTRAEPLRVAYHSACSLQHGQQVRGAPKELLKAAGVTVVEPRDAHLCCGSAGTYSLTQPALSRQLRDNKLNALESGKPDAIVTANIGCQTHLDGAGRTPVRHWIEIVEEAMA